MATSNPGAVTGTGDNDFGTKIYLRFIPLRWGLKEVHKAFSKYGNIRRIERDPKRFKNGWNAWLEFMPGALRESLIKERVEHSVIKDSKVTISCEFVPLSNYIPKVVNIDITHVDIGVLRDADKFVSYHSTASGSSFQSFLSFNASKTCLELAFEPHSASSSAKVVKISTHLNQIKTFALLSGAAHENHHRLLLTLEAPPFVYERDVALAMFDDRRARVWSEANEWRRKTNITSRATTNTTPIRLQTTDTLIDAGRWLTYVVTLSPETFESPRFKRLTQNLMEHDVVLQSDMPMDIAIGNLDDMQKWACVPILPTGSSSNVDSLNQMTHSAIELPFRTQYQLEVCLSQHVLHECNLSRAFITELARLQPDNIENPMAATRASRLLEKAAEIGRRIYDPLALFSLTPTPSRSKIPRYCALLPAVIVTPTTIYSSTPGLETSNRVVRQFWNHADRFLRVKFSDERYFGRPMSVTENDTSHDEIFARIEKAMKFGIVVAGRHYEFLAFANSQFRDNGAWFFASTNTLTAAKIRDWMGNFTHIPVVAKYISRLGQCLSTTRAMSIPVVVETIPDIERNGFNFTDGVGRMSPFLAHMIADELKIPNAAADYPSVVQFRLGGCKGILAVDPNLKGRTVQIRPSQEKFAAYYHGLEICRVSNFGSASLNSQVIMVLSALGVPDNIFVDKLKHILDNIAQAMHNEQRAIKELTTNVDHNRITLSMATMLRHGFMASHEPFVLSCLRLWRSWMVKHLRDKAHIFVEQGAFVLGCVDEIGVLSGHVDCQYDEQNVPIGTQPLPEIFIQIPEKHDERSGGPYKVIAGVCLLMRNPSLHPGDARVVMAVDRPELRHLKNCVVFPQTGDRDLANMCSGGDLDGDDYLVIWDETLVPKQRNHQPMDYYAKTPVTCNRPIQVEDMTSFFVEHIKHDNLSRIAVAHRYWADYEPEGVKSNVCLELAHLHSTAVDYAKTGVAAVVRKELFVRRWPHWSQAKNKPQQNMYRSKKILGQLFDAVEYVAFEPVREVSFDERIMQAFELDEELLNAAREVKLEYDSALRRLMIRHGIKTEFEAWTTFALQHDTEWNAYRFAEKFGEAIAALKDHYVSACYTRAGTNATLREWNKIGPFIAAMYTVTAEEVTSFHQNKDVVVSDNPEGEPYSKEPEPFMSFPWLFAHELGQIANSRKRHLPALTTTQPRQVVEQIARYDSPMQDPNMAEVKDMKIAENVVHDGDLLDLYHQYDDEGTTSSTP